MYVCVCVYEWVCVLCLCMRVWNMWVRASVRAFVCASVYDGTRDYDMKLE